MNNEEMKGRLNALSMAVEIALIETFTLKHGEVGKALVDIRKQLDGLIRVFEADQPPSDFRTGTVGGLNLILGRLEGIFDPSQPKRF